MNAVELEFAPGNSRFEKAYEEVLPALRALPDAQIVAVNLSIPNAVTKVLGVQPRLLAMKDAIAGAISETERDLPERLGHYAYALFHAHALYRMAVRSNDPIPPLVDEGMKLRRLLFSDARAAIHRGFVDGRALRGYKGGASGYRNLAFELHVLAQLLRSCPESARDCTAARPAELERADELGATILQALRRRKMPGPAAQVAADVRNRAFTLLTRGYDRMRRAVVHLRWDEGDADELVPSLYTKHHRPKKTTETREAPERASDSRSFWESAGLL